MREVYWSVLQSLPFKMTISASPSGEFFVLFALVFIFSFCFSTRIYVEAVRLEKQVEYTDGWMDVRADGRMDG